jgi:hypothetical protein
MATAKTPKKTSAARPPARPAARPAAAKSPEDAIVHSAEIVGDTVAKSADTAAERTVQAARTVSEAAPAAARTADTIAETAVRQPARAVTTVAAKAAGETQETVMKGVVPFLDFGRDHAILMITAGNEFALGLHRMSQSLIDWSAESCDRGVAAGQAMLSAKTVEEVIDLSQALAKDGLQQLLKEGNELSALSSKLIEDTIVPLPGRLVAAVEKLAAHAA